VTGAVILVVDDEVQVRRFLRATLTSHGFQCLEAATAEDGLRELAQRQPDVVLLDLSLPDLDGIEFTRRVRGWSKVPILVLSARGQEKDKVAALESGADD
jgi:two-component system KDP operon response regulator KdpE